MNWDLILDYVRALVWPVVIVGVLVVFRGQIRAWLSRPPTSIQTPVGSVHWDSQEVEWQLEDDSDDADEALAEFDDAEFFEALSDQIRAEVEREVDEERLRELTLTQLRLDFETLFNRIYGTQVSLLEKLAEDDRDDEYMTGWFEGVAKKFPVFQTPEWSRDAYLYYLLNNGLIDEEPPGTYRLTDKGRAFLAYLGVVGYNKVWRNF